MSKIPLRNSIDAYNIHYVNMYSGVKNNLPIFACEPKQKISQYTGVCWHKRQDKWSVDLCLQGVKKKFGGYFNDELDAAKRINQLCEEFGIPHKNHGIGTIINQEVAQLFLYEV